MLTAIPDHLKAEVIEAAAAQVTTALDIGEPIVLDFQPGNGTRYVLAFSPALTEHDARLLGAEVVVALVNFHSGYAFSFPGYFTDDYVEEKLFAHTGGRGDAAAVAALFNRVCHRGE